MIGQRAIDDPRNSLVKDFVRIVRELDASYFVFENVKGITVGRHKKFLEELILEFKDSGYDVVEDWKVLNACEYGTPQSRQRLFLLGAKRGLKLPAYPIATTSKPGSYDSKLPNAPTCFDALNDIPNAERYTKLLTSDEVLVEKWGKTSAYAKLMRCVADGDWGYGYKRKWNPSLLTSSMRSDHTELSRSRFSATTPGDVEPVSRFFKLPPDGVSNTLRAGTDSARGAFTSPRPIHYKWDRCVTVREMARLHGFPDWFRFNETKWHGARQIGNAVPPPLARAVASSIMLAMGTNPTAPTKLLSLGNDRLLRMSLAQAAIYWDIPNPIGQRNKKSGTKKRKQQSGDSAQIPMLV